MRNLDCDILNNPLNKKHEKESVQKQPLTFTQIVMLEIMQLLPIFSVYGMLELTDNANATMATFFMTMITLPLIYCFLYKENIKSILMGDGLNRIGHQLKQGSLAGFGILAIALGSYYAFLGLDSSHHSWIMSRNIPVKKTFFDTALFFFVFSFINPLLEELFWRGFLLKSYRDRKLSYVIVSIHFALYHWFSVNYITQNWLFSTAATFSIFVLGAKLMYLREKCGMVAAVLAHAGADLAVAIIVWHIYSGIQI